MSRSRIGWTDETWNPVTGCDRVSPGCDHCYAERLAWRLQRMGVAGYERGFEVVVHPERLEEPRHWRKPRRVFVCSMSDLFQPEVGAATIAAVFDVMRAAPRHTFQILTKRPGRMAQLLDGGTSGGPLPQNVWLGTSIELDAYCYRADRLRSIPTPNRFLSLEPLLGPLPSLNLEGIGWVIVGGESGPGHRPMEADWVRDIRDRCVGRGIPFFFKQWAGPRPGGVAVLDGVWWQQTPQRSEATS